MVVIDCVLLNPYLLIFYHLCQSLRYRVEQSQEKGKDVLDDVDEEIQESQQEIEECVYDIHILSRRTKAGLITGLAV
jgi:hypothetical protein